MDAILGGLVNLGVGGVMAAALVWFLYWMVTRTLPQMTEQFGKELKDKRESYLAELRHEREQFRIELQEERSLRERAVTAIVEAVEELQKNLASEHQAMMQQAHDMHGRLLDRLAQGFEQLVQESTENRTLIEGLVREPRRKVTRKPEGPAAVAGGGGAAKPS